MGKIFRVHLHGEGECLCRALPFPWNAEPMRRPQISLALLRLIVLTIVVVGAAVTVLVVGTDGLGDLLESAADSRLGIAAFMGLYIAGVVLMVPGTLGTFTSGAVLGFAVGFPVAVVAALIGATIAFFLSRLVGKEGMNELLGDRLTSIDDWLKDNDFCLLYTSDAADE